MMHLVILNKFLEDDKKLIYDASFNAIKEEKFAFKLPKGKKIEAPQKAVEA